MLSLLSSKFRDSKTKLGSLIFIHLSSKDRSPFLSFSPRPILAEWLPNCIALFFLLLASTRPTFRAASRSSNFSPKPASKRGSIFMCTGSSARKFTTDSDRKGCRVSFPHDEMTRSSRPKFLVGIRSISVWSCRSNQYASSIYSVRFTSSMTACQPAALNAVLCRP